MMNLFRTICLTGVLVGAIAAATPAAAERGDHDTPATRDQWQYDTPWRYGAPACRTDKAGWVLCRDNSGRWQRHHREGRNDGRWWDDRDNDRRGGWYGGPPERIDSRVVARRLHDQGFRNLRDMKLRGDVYSLKATDPYGRAVIVQVHPYTGRIVNIVRR